MTDIERLKRLLDSVVDWDNGEYERGFTNGLIMAIATLENKEPVFMQMKGVRMWEN